MNQAHRGAACHRYFCWIFALSVAVGVVIVPRGALAGCGNGGCSDQKITTILVETGTVRFRISDESQLGLVGCNNGPYLVLPNDALRFKEMYALLLTAKAADLSINFDAYPASHPKSNNLCTVWNVLLK